MPINVNDTLKALSATLDDIDRVLFEAESSLVTGAAQRDHLIRAREQVLRAIDELQRVSGR